MGSHMSNMYDAYVTSPDTAPSRNNPPTFEPLYGFTSGRKEREMKVTEEEMMAAGLTGEERDYCAHHLIDFYKCRRENFPWVAACADIKHAWDSCEYEDWVMRMKEYEREKRLLKRAKRKGQLNNNEQLLAA